MEEKIGEAEIEFEILDEGVKSQERMGLLHKDSCCISRA